MILSKSDYMLFLRHPAWLWLKKFAKNKLPSIDDNLQAVFDEGHEFENYAERIFSDSIKIGFDQNNFDSYKAMPVRTREALQSGNKSILQGRFETDRLTCIVDVLEKAESNTFDLIEIKSSTRAKPEHEYDLAFQLVVLEQSGLKIRNVSVIHANKEYVRKGEIDPVQLTNKTDVTEKVRRLMQVTNEQIKKALEILTLKEMPDLSPRYVNQVGVPNTQWFNEWLEVYKHLKPDLDKFSIYALSYPSAEQISKLEDKNIELIKDVPEEMALRPKQVGQIQTTRNNNRIINKQEIKKFIDSFEYPLYFFDYETFSSVIPFFDGNSPYGDYPFQYSLHVLETPQSELKHTEYLHSTNSNPMPELINKLKQDIGDKGTILTWNMSYEKGCNMTLARLYPEHAEFFEAVNQRINDLMTSFANMWFVDKDMFGSASIKKVLPVVVPELSYKELDVSDGLLARRMWTETVLKGKNKDRKEKIISDLSKYCTLDTFAMVRILEELKNLVEI